MVAVSQIRAVEFRQRGSRLRRLLDRIAHPPIQYSSNLYHQQLLTHFRRMLRGPRRVRHAFAATHLILAWCISVLATPVCCLVYIMGYRFLSIDLSQIGMVGYIDPLLRRLMLSKEISKSKIFVPSSRFTDANDYAFGLYEPYVTFVRNEWLKLLLSPFFTNPFFHTTPHDVDLAHTYSGGDDEKRTFVHEIQYAFEERFHGPLISIPEQDRKTGQKILARMLPDSRPFVAMHVRESGFYGNQSLTTRNGDVRSNAEAIKYLIDVGYTVVRLGDSTMSNIDDLVEAYKPYLVDYARSEHQSEMMDCFLVSECAFYFSGSSGLTFLAYAFGKDVCSVNWCNANGVLGFTPRSVATFKKIQYIDSGKLVPFSQLMVQPLKANMQKHDYALLGVELVDNTSEEILETIQEMVNPEGTYDVELQERAKSMSRVGTYNDQARGRFSEAILKVYDSQDALN